MVTDMKHLVLVYDSELFNFNEVVLEVHWRDKDGNLRKYIHKKTKNDVLAIDFKIHDIAKNKSVELV